MFLKAMLSNASTSKSRFVSTDVPTSSVHFVVVRGSDYTLCEVSCYNVSTA